MDIAIIFYCRGDIKKYRYLGNWVSYLTPPDRPGPGPPIPSWRPREEAGRAGSSG